MGVVAYFFDSGENFLAAAFTNMTKMRCRSPVLRSRSALLAKRRLNVFKRNVIFNRLFIMLRLETPIHCLFLESRAGFAFWEFCQGCPRNTDPWISA
jgi:hypothetical protein